MAKIAPMMAIVFAVAAVAGLMALPVANNLAAEQYVALDDENYANEVMSFTTVRGEIEESELIVGTVLPGWVTVLDKSGAVLGTLDTRVGAFTPKMNVPAPQEIVRLDSFGSGIDREFLASSFEAVAVAEQQANYKVGVTETALGTSVKTIREYILYVDHVTDIIVDSEGRNIVRLVGDGFQIEALYGNPMMAQGSISTVESEELWTGPVNPGLYVEVQQHKYLPLIETDCGDC